MLVTRSSVFQTGCQLTWWKLDCTGVCFFHETYHVTLKSWGNQDLQRNSPQWHVFFSPQIIVLLETFETISELKSLWVSLAMFKKLFCLGFSPLKKQSGGRGGKKRNPAPIATGTCGHLRMTGSSLLGNAVNAYACRFAASPPNQWILPSVYLHFLRPVLARVLAYWAWLACKLHFCSPPVKLEFHCPHDFFFCPPHSWIEPDPSFYPLAVTWKHSISLLTSGLTI